VYDACQKINRYCGQFRHEKSKCHFN